MPVPAICLHCHITLKSGWCSYITDSHPLQEHLEPQTVPAASARASLLLSLPIAGNSGHWEVCERWIKILKPAINRHAVWYKVHTSTKKWWRAHKWQGKVENHRSVNSFHISVAKGTVSRQYFLQTTMIWILWLLVGNDSVYSGSVEKLGITCQDLVVAVVDRGTGTPA